MQKGPVPAQRFILPLGEMDKAFSCLLRAVEARSAGLIYLNVDPVYDALRADPRFAAVLTQVGVR